MHRDKYTAKLVRIIESIESGSIPMDVRELYVFGSYSRGAIEPGDLDLVIVHGAGIQKIDREVDAALQKSHPDIMERMRVAHGKHNAARMKIFRKPGEAVQIMFCQSLSDVTGAGSRIKQADPILVWSHEDHRWREKIDAIRPDLHAGRAERNHLVKLKRLYDGVSDMEEIVAMIDQQIITFSRISVTSILVKLNLHHQAKLEHWIKCKVMGKQSIGMLPYVMWWFEQYGSKCEVPNRTEVWDSSRTLRCEVGKPSLRRMLARFEAVPKLKLQCLIPHFKRTDSNDLLVFERGLQWQDRKWIGAPAPDDVPPSQQH